MVLCLSSEGRRVNGERVRWGIIVHTRQSREAETVTASLEKVRGSGKGRLIKVEKGGQGCVNEARQGWMRLVGASRVAAPGKPVATTGHRGSRFVAC